MQNRRERKLTCTVIGPKMASVNVSKETTCKRGRRSATAPLVNFVPFALHFFPPPPHGGPGNISIILTVIKGKRKKGERR